jgi:hypothetical protein
MILALILLAIAIACYSVIQLGQHGKLKWMDANAGYWGMHSSIRKYKYINGKVQQAPDNWYYRFFKVPYKESFPLSATFLVSFTDYYHTTQSLFFIALAASIYLLSGINFLIIWALILLINFLTYKILSK